MNIGSTVGKKGAFAAAGLSIKMAAAQKAEQFIH